MAMDHANKNLVPRLLVTAKTVVTRVGQRVHLVTLRFLTYSYLRNLVYIISQYIRYSLATGEDVYGI